MKKTVTIELPEEFIIMCQNNKLEPEELLRGFIGDLCGIVNFSNNPRSDGYNSHGSDERDLAYAWFDRAYPDYSLFEKE